MSERPYSRFSTLWTVLALVVGSSATFADTIVLPEDERANLRSRIGVFVDRSKKARYEDVISPAYADSFITYGPTDWMPDSDVWYRLEIRNESNEEDWAVKMWLWYLDWDVDLFDLSTGKPVERLSQLHATSKVWEIHVPSGQNRSFLIQARARPPSSAVLPMSVVISTPQRFIDYGVWIAHLDAVNVGIALAMLL